jgi:hypothetical protein
VESGCTPDERQYDCFVLAGTVCPYGCVALIGATVEFFSCL